MMRRLYYILAICLLSLAAVGCSSMLENPADSAQGEARIEVGMDVTLPLPSLPGTRAVTNESTINDYEVWVFSDGAFVEAIHKDESYTDQDDHIQPKIRLTNDNGGNLYVLLKESLTNVRLMMVANCTVTAPTEGTSWADAESALENAQFTYDGQGSMDMPFYGFTSESDAFDVELGANGGQIQLIRALAKVDLYVTDEDGHFVLTALHVYQATKTGTVKQKTTLLPGNGEQMYGTVLTSSDDPDFAYHAQLFMPEVGSIKNNSNENINSTNTYVIFEGRFKSYTSEDWENRYFRLDFIKRSEDASGNVSYTVLDKIERNHRYIFRVEYLTATSGKTTLADAVANQAVNFYDPTALTTMSVINESEIMNITTDNYVYLGVTADNLTAQKSDQNGDYWALFYVMTNNVNGWYFDTLPTGVSVTTQSWIGSAPESTPVYVWIPSSYASGSKVTLYLFASRIRKKIVITVP